MHVSKEKFERVLIKYLPKDWAISHLPIPEMDALGCAYDFTIHIPECYQIKILFVFLHEVAHIKKRHVMETLKPYWAKEYECERWAASIARKEGIELPPWLEEESRRYVRVQYKYYLKICRMYDVTAPWNATPAQLKWMEYGDR